MLKNFLLPNFIKNKAGRIKVHRLAVVAPRNPKSYNLYIKLMIIILLSLCLGIYSQCKKSKQTIRRL